MTREEELTLLLEGVIGVEGRIVESSNQALLVSVSLDGVDALACYKSELGERPLWDFPDGLWRREVAAYALDTQLGTDLVPTTVARDDGPFGPGSYQWWIQEDGEEHYFTLRDRPEFHRWFENLAAFDVVANNADRKSGHVLYDGTRLWAIDNGLCFHEDDKLRTVIWDYAGRSLDEEITGRLERFSHGDVGELSRWLSPSELALCQLRAQGLAEDARYPEPDENSSWPPYPWPLI